MPGQESDFLDLRKKMVAEQIIRRGIDGSRVLQAMEQVPRHLFVPMETRAHAYDDAPMSVGFGQTISQPYVVALMTHSLKVKPGDKVLEVGTGSGYQAAILAECGAETCTVEIIPELAQRARQNLKNTGYLQIQVKTGNGMKGWKEQAPFDAILVTCAPETVPDDLESQLIEGGRIVIPVGPKDKIQDLLLIGNLKGNPVRESLGPVRFVPMI